jgi:undecaprenyl diphosphate synthase
MINQPHPPTTHEGAFQQKGLKIPEHVAIIMDGNGRWAKKRNQPRINGHRQGVKALKRSIEASVEFGVKQLSLYVFSTENWTRPEKEVAFLWNMMLSLIVKEVTTLHKENVRVKFLGFRGQLEDKLLKKIEWAEQLTDGNDRLQVNLMLNYGSRQDILRVVNKLKSSSEEITEEMFSKELFTSDIPDPDLMIRTGGDLRVSNFLLWELAYTELWFTKSLWPEFNRTMYQKAIEAFTKRDRRYGGLNE